MERTNRLPWQEGKFESKEEKTKKWSDDVFSNYKENKKGDCIGLERAYFVAASYHHVPILTDKIMDGVVSVHSKIGSSSSDYAVTELPSGESFRVPRRPSVVAIQMAYDIPPYMGKML